MKDQITFIIFSMDSPEETNECVKALKSKNVIVFYTSSDQDRERLQSIAPELKIIPAPGFGYPEPLRPWAEGFVSTPYLFIIDTDERMSDALSSFIFTETLDENIYKIFRVESSRKSGTWQTRLYKKGSIEWRGLVHEQPGDRSIKLPKNLMILHNDKSLKHSRTYNRLNAFMPQSTLEVIIRSFGVGFILAGPEAILQLPQTIKNVYKQKHLSTKEDKEIRRAIKRKGLVKYLSLDDPETISSIISKYGAVPHGTDLLVELMRKKHSGQNP